MFWRSAPGAHISFAHTDFSVAKSASARYRFVIVPNDRSYSWAPMEKLEGLFDELPNWRSLPTEPLFCTETVEDPLPNFGYDLRWP